MENQIKYNTELKDKDGKTIKSHDRVVALIVKETDYFSPSGAKYWIFKVMWYPILQKFVFVPENFEGLFYLEENEIDDIQLLAN